jgi:hydroxymethylbilane synthase
MALVQTGRVRAALAAANPSLASPDAIEIVPIVTTADRVQDRKLSEIGGKALFTKELEEALLTGAVDMAVHSMKDVETFLPAGLEIACVMARDDPRDAFVSHGRKGFAELPAGSVVGTSSLRRQAQILHRWPSLSVVPYRGNVNTRLKKLAEGVVDATLLAVAGLERIGRLEAVSALLSVEEMLPAVGQGAIGIEIRARNDEARRWIEPLKDARAEICVGAERSLLATLDGSCHTPIGGYATLDDRGALRLMGLLASPDGKQLLCGERSGGAGDGARLGAELGTELRAREREALSAGA